MRTRTNDPHKVQELMDSIAQIGLQVPEKDSAFNYLNKTALNHLDELIRSMCLRSMELTTDFLDVIVLRLISA
ncbi:hypothetical protein OSB04_000842 [Centaurea solstitialis]|uniref:Uncharacterized protein n=1 Tax=Centaurea solstitialis TaxID=347529 RepID=A0AA38WUQ3_9ASTR|nr:hypothetical protein OSB04_000842 [Centaurea solstitialis]